MRTVSLPHARLSAGQCQSPAMSAPEQRTAPCACLIARTRNDDCVEQTFTSEAKPGASKLGYAGRRGKQCVLADSSDCLERS